MGEVEGIAAEPVSEWFDANIDGAGRPYRFELIAGGRSNLTYLVTDGAGRRYVLRRPPTSHVLPSAHDMGREYRIIKSLGPTRVPVPPALGYCEDEAVNGRPFYVMGYIDGNIVRDVDIARRVYTPEQRRVAGEDLIDVLVELHGLDVDAIGLGDLGRRDGYIERQLRRWYGQFQQSAATHGRSVPIVDEVHDFLSSRVPTQQGTAIVHGDYRLDNTMFDGDGKVVAVLDWELCTLGDPLADMGLLMVYWTEPGDSDVLLGFAPTAAEGFLSRAELRERYSRASDRDLSALDFYVAFGYWKLACIIEGVYARYAAGAMGGDRSGFEGFGHQVQTLAEAARDAASKL
jgi:aminoglycoside phosphotransferase (APT) family kinase protein